MSELAASKDIWDKLRSLGHFIGGVGVPLVIAWLGNSYNAAIKDSENRVKYVEIAIAELRSTPRQETEALRVWVVDLLDSQAPVKLSPEAREQLKRFRSLGSDGGGDAGDGNPLPNTGAFVSGTEKK